MRTREEIKAEYNDNLKFDKLALEILLDLRDHLIGEDKKDKKKNEK